MALPLPRRGEAPELAIVRADYLVTHCFIAAGLHYPYGETAEMEGSEEGQSRTTRHLACGELTCYTSLLLRRVISKENCSTAKRPRERETLLPPLRPRRASTRARRYSYPVIPP